MHYLRCQEFSTVHKRIHFPPAKIEPWQFHKSTSSALVYVTPFDNLPRSIQHSHTLRDAYEEDEDAEAVCFAMTKVKKCTD